jgi:hypothetical protein
MDPCNWLAHCCAAIPATVATFATFEPIYPATLATLATLALANIDLQKKHRPVFTQKIGNKNQFYTFIRRHVFLAPVLC